MRVDGLLRGGRDSIEADIGEEDDGGAAQNSAPAENAGPLIWRDEGTFWVACRHPILCADEGNARGVASSASRLRQ